MSFDRFADAVSGQVRRAWFFAACVLLILLWAPLILFTNLDTWQLIINTLTTIITFLLVALLHNDQSRFENATNARIQALLERFGVEDPVDDPGQQPRED